MIKYRQCFLYQNTVLYLLLHFYLSDLKMSRSGEQESICQLLQKQRNHTEINRNYDTQSAVISTI